MELQVTIFIYCNILTDSKGVGLVRKQVGYRNNEWRNSARNDADFDNIRNDYRFIDLIEVYDEVLSEDLDDLNCLVA